MEKIIRNAMRYTPVPVPGKKDDAGSWIGVILSCLITALPLLIVFMLVFSLFTWMIYDSSSVEDTEAYEYGTVSYDIDDPSLIRLINIAVNEKGYKGGEKYWRWYGFNRHAAWCACFVSWCSDRAGLIAEGRVPRYALCANGIKWFRTRKRFISVRELGSVGMIIFYDRRSGNGLGQDGTSDHTGIVTGGDREFIYTVEGNWGDKVSLRKVRRDDPTIMGFGVP
ncbi:MAG: CHAP domain-containing protein [Clostridia bacterium]|nr:CHAP domain-containing protein [Clostridia bacterium]